MLLLRPILELGRDKVLLFQSILKLGRYKVLLLRPILELGRDKVLPFQSILELGRDLYLIQTKPNILGGRAVARIMMISSEPINLWPQH